MSVPEPYLQCDANDITDWVQMVVLTAMFSHLSDIDFFNKLDPSLSEKLLWIYFFNSVPLELTYHGFWCNDQC